ncbi:MAG: hypothetical protein JJE35_12230 [Thermoleophilia bacterium]|nr:hypothetical protein [Thermoleophilia bacterium]
MTILSLACSIPLLSVAFASAGETEPLSGRAAASPSGQLALLGTWTGHRERIASTDGYRSGTSTLRVTQQKGLTFKGTMTWSTPDGPITEPLVGAYTPGGNLITGADEEGTYTFSLVNARTLDYCYAEAGDGYRTTCARLKKQSPK